MRRLAVLLVREHGPEEAAACIKRMARSTKISRATGLRLVEMIREEEVRARLRGD
jgi:hypothetical protein